MHSPVHPLRIQRAWGFIGIAFWSTYSFVPNGQAEPCPDDTEGCRQITTVPATAEANHVIFSGAVNGESYDITAAGVWAQDPDPQYNTGPDGLASFGNVFSGPFTGILFGAFAVKEPGSSSWVFLGSSGSITATADGPILGSFADLPGLYGDNTGVMHVTVVHQPCDEPEPMGSPFAFANATPSVSCGETSLTLDGSGSTDSDGATDGICSYTWTIKRNSDPQEVVEAIEDGSAQELSSALSAGDYEITLTVTDHYGNTADAFASATIMGVSFDPTAVTVTPGTSESLILTTIPECI